MMNDERYVRKGYKIWDTYSDREVQELNYRSQSDDMCEVLNEKEAIIQRLELENEKLQKQLESSETTSDATSHYNAHLESKITTLEKENEQLRQFINKGRRLSVKELMDNANENELLKKKIKGLEKENEELKRERDSWKSSTCSYMNKDSVLSMDCQIVQEALWELEKEIEFGSKREDLFFDLKEKFEKLNNHRIGVF